MSKSPVLYLSKLLHRLRLAWYRRTRPEAVMAGDPFQQIWVDPHDIKYSLKAKSLNAADHLAPLRDGRFCKYSAIGLVEDGDWDTKVGPYAPQNSLLYEAMSHRYHGEKEWQETAFYARTVEQVDAGQRPWNGCKTHKDILQRCLRADRLIQSIRQNGITETAHAVVICIGSDGRLIKAGNGQHRTMLGLITGSKIPVLPVVRHKVWEDIRTGRAPDSQAFADHPDFLTPMAH